MKSKRLATIGLSAVLATAAVGGLQAAGRALDNPLPVHEATGDGGAPSSGFYTGRPNDNSYVERPRAEGGAEFAQMEVHGEPDEAEGAGFHGRPQDNPHLAQ